MYTSTGKNISSFAIRAVCGDTGGEQTGVVPCVANENSDCTGENSGRTGVCGCASEDVDCTGENGASGCGVNENAGCTGENGCCTGVGCVYAIFTGSGCGVNTNPGCTGECPDENAVFTSSGAPLCGEYGVNADCWGEYGGRLDVRGDARTSTGKTALLGVVSDTCNVDGGNRGNCCFSSPRYNGGGVAACCGTLKALVGVRGGAVEMKLAVDFLVLRLMASYGSRSGDSYAARRARPC